MSRIGNFASVVAAHVPKPGRILEVGCGAGELSRLLKDAGYDVLAIDPKAPEGVAAERAPFESFDAAPASFDAVVMQLVLHHVAHLPSFLDKAQSLLRGESSVIAIDDYGWERASDEVPEQWKRDREDLHTSKAMLAELRGRFVQRQFFSHAYLHDGAGDDRIAFTFIGTRRIGAHLRSSNAR